MMANPNLGPELSDPGDPEGTESNRRKNPASVHLDESPARVIETAQARASTVSHRFGGTRYALTRSGPDVPGTGQPAAESNAEPTDQPSAEPTAEAGAEPAPSGEDATDDHR
jgi:hypothetical protein